ncbi:hydroxyisourate hydrolase [Demequina sp. NBRC 110057]|uniref:hydroxyisourate hydrolase n=1 Tax=Demequina sp. NBRC 110057 TaxID=1570346 RepID=UPI0009FCEDF4|nr:hydroxyisourate hydrolase [Demequina sp. NBRC 110057]
MSHLTTHVLDAMTGTPAEGVAVTLSGREDGGWEPLASGVTDGDGRIGEIGPERLSRGDYQVRFDTGMYFQRRGVESFYPEVVITFSVGDGAHYHVPLLLSPFAYSTYRGS